MTASSRDKMIKAAERLLRRSGLSGAGINQVIAASGAPKGSLYHYFPGGKNELVIAALESFDAKFSAYLAATFHETNPYAKAVRCLFAETAQALQSSDFRLGCPVAAVTLDIGGDDQPVRDVCARIVAGWRTIISTSLRDVPPAKRDALAAFIVTALQGGLVVARAQRDVAPLLNAGDMLSGLNPVGV